MAGKCAEDRDMRKRTLRKEICDYIQNQIAQGRFRPGDRIVETQLARELNVSQAPVREAILELSAMGLLEERPYAGCIVRRMTADDIADIYNVRAHIDEYAARLAAQRITSRQLEDMERLLREMDGAPDIQSFVQKDIAFHTMVVDAAGSPALFRMWQNLRLSEWTNLSVAATECSLERLKHHHWQIYHLLKAHDAHGAGAYTFLHIKGFGDELKRRLAAAAGGDSEPLTALALHGPEDGNAGEE